MTYYEYLYVYIFTVICCIVCHGQTTRIAELKKVVFSAKNPDEKLHAIFSL